MTPLPDVVCLSHLRWGFVYQRPNHLMSRCAKNRRVFFVEEPVYGAAEPRLEITRLDDGLHVVVPHLREEHGAVEAQRRLLADLFRERRIVRPIIWLYTPMALPLVPALDVAAVVFDCMDELSAFRGAPARLHELEQQTFRAADLVFTGGRSLYEAKRHLHAAVHAFPSSVDYDSFARARAPQVDPSDQASIPHPRVGFFGVVDERMDLALIARVADERPGYQLVMLGPVVKIDPASLPRAHNIHWLGPKSYPSLHTCLAGWDVAMMPFALNASTRFISPTKTLEYLAAGRPVVSTAIRDVVSPYGDMGVVAIADASTFSAAIDAALEDGDDGRRRTADAVVAATSWDATWAAMEKLMDQAVTDRAAKREGALSCSTI